MLEHHLAEHLAVGARPWVGASHEDSQAAAQSAVWGAGDFQRTTRTYDTRVQSKIHSLANSAEGRGVGGSNLPGRVELEGGIWPLTPEASGTPGAPLRWG